MRYAVDWMRLKDIPAVMRVERESFGDAWPPGSYERELTQNRLAHYLVLREVQERTDREKPAVELLYTVSREDDYWATPSPGTVIGHAGLWLLFDEAHITTIAVSQGHRGRGLGELLLVAAIDVAAVLGGVVVTLEVRLSNQVAQQLYEKYGFARTGLRRRYYSDNHEDAVIMTSEPIGSAAFQDRFRLLRAANRARLERLCAAGDA